MSAANDRLQELDRLKSKFVSDVSHELRTPVTSLSLYLELMNHGKAEKKAHYLEQATGQTARLRDLIEEILDLSRLEWQRTGLERHVLDLNDIVDQAITEQQPAAETAGLVLGRSGQIEPLQVQGDPGQLQRAHQHPPTQRDGYLLKSGRYSPRRQLSVISSAPLMMFSRAASMAFRTLCDTAASAPWKGAKPTPSSFKLYST